MEDVLRKVIDYTISGGVHGVFVLGSTGEFYGLEWEQNKTIKIIKKHYKIIAKSTKLPIILYGNDSRTNVNLPSDLIVELAYVENIVGVKDSSGDMTKMGEYIRLTIDKEFNVIAGRDTLILANLVYGGAGAIAMTANIAPSIVAGIYNSFKANDIKKAREYQFQLSPLRISLGLGSFPVVMKEALKLVGIDAGVTLSPIGPISEDNKNKLAGILKKLNVYQIF